MGVPSFSLAVMPMARETLASFMAAASAGAFWEASAFSSASFSCACAIAATISTARAMLADFMWFSSSRRRHFALAQAPHARTSELRSVLAAALLALRAERGLDALGQVLGAPETPEVQEQDPRLLARHVLMNGDDVDARSTQGLQDTLQLRLEHRE